MTINKKNDYVSVIYNDLERPFTSYPEKLSRYLFNRYNLQENQTILDIGCGRGEFLDGFIKCGLKGFAVDQSPNAINYFPDINLKISDIENDGIPYPDSNFDIIYSKSVIEHFYDPSKLIKEIYRLLKPGGLVITLCPSWEYNYKIYFEDYTHRTPFMHQSLKDIQKINGFIDVRVEFFRQLPILWEKKWLIPFSQLTNLLAPNFLKKKSKWVKWSKEIMLLSSSLKPQ